MLAAVYARKSTVQSGTDDKSDSVERQIAHARAYATRKGWSVADAHVYVDDGISGAEFGDRRPGLARLLNALRPAPPFQVLVMSEESRLGRESIEVAYALKTFAQAGVRVFLYLEDRERTIESATDKLLMSVAAYADEMERHQAAVVRRIFELCAAGWGGRRIAVSLNADGALALKPRRSQRPRSWAPSSVREILHRDLYRGEIVWNRRRKRDAWGRKKPTMRPASEWLRVPAPHLRIVDEDLWRSAHAPLEAGRSVYLTRTQGQTWGPAQRCRLALPLDRLHGLRDVWRRAHHADEGWSRSRALAHVHLRVLVLPRRACVRQPTGGAARQS